MEKILDIITSKMQQAFADAGYDAAFASDSFRLMKPGMTASTME